MSQPSDTCHGCGSRRCDTPFARKRKGEPLRCQDCVAWLAGAAERAERRARRAERPCSRRSYRAAFRWRQSQAQLDLVDMLVASP